MFVLGISDPPIWHARGDTSRSIFGAAVDRSSVGTGWSATITARLMSAWGSGGTGKRMPVEACEQAWLSTFSSSGGVHGLGAMDLLF